MLVKPNFAMNVYERLRHIKCQRFTLGRVDFHVCQEGSSQSDGSDATDETVVLGLSLLFKKDFM